AGSITSSTSASPATASSTTASTATAAPATPAGGRKATPRITRSLPAPSPPPARAVHPQTRAARPLSNGSPTAERGGAAQQRRSREGGFRGGREHPSRDV